MTDELFDEIATKVLNEDDLTVEGAVILLCILHNFNPFTYFFVA